MELDHFFIGFASIDAVSHAAAMLQQAGFTEGSGRTHPGQGSQNRRYFFDNVMIELLWIHDQSEASLPHNHTLDLINRCQSIGLNRFGVCFRPSPVKRHPGMVRLADLLEQSGPSRKPTLCSDHRIDSLSPLFLSDALRPQYLPPTMAIDIAVDSIQMPFKAQEPLWFHLSFARPQRTLQQTEPLTHPNGCSALTDCTLLGAVSNNTKVNNIKGSTSQGDGVQNMAHKGHALSLTAQQIVGAGLLAFATSTEPAAALHLVFDHARQQQCVAFGDVLPLVLWY